MECKNASGCHNAITVNHFVIKSKEIKAVRLAGDGLNADRAARRDGDVCCGIAGKVPMLSVKLKKTDDPLKLATQLVGVYAALRAQTAGT